MRGQQKYSVFTATCHIHRGECLIIKNRLRAAHRTPNAKRTLPPYDARHDMPVLSLPTVQRRTVTLEHFTAPIPSS